MTAATIERAPAAICGANATFPAERVGCGLPIGTCAEVYRCTDCSVPFHRDCANAHFRTSPPVVGDRLDTGCYARKGQACEGLLTHGCRHCGRIIGSPRPQDLGIDPLLPAGHPRNY